MPRTAIANLVGHPHLLQLARMVRCSNCIDRPQERIIVQRSGEIHRPQFVAMKSAVKLMTLGNAWRSAKDHGRTGKCYFVNCPNLHQEWHSWGMNRHFPTCVGFMVRCYLAADSDAEVARSFAPNGGRPDECQIFSIADQRQKTANTRFWHTEPACRRQTPESPIRGVCHNRSIDETVSDPFRERGSKHTGDQPYLTP